MVEVSIIIVTWNSGRFIKDCLESIFKQSFSNYEIIIVDNDSNDKTKEIIKSCGFKVRLIENIENKGFCYANNQAIKICNGKYILTLNSDVILEREYIRTLKTYLDKNSSVGMVQGLYLRMDGKTIDSAGLFISRTKRLFNIENGRISNNNNNNKEKEIFGPCAAAAIYRRKLFEDIRIGNEFFDNDFFFLVEDFDIAWRARKKGWKATYVPQAFCYHYGHSSAHDHLYKQYLSFRNRYLLLLKNETCKSALLFLPFFIVYDIPRFLYLLFNNPYIIRGINEIRQLFPNSIKKRVANTLKRDEKIYA